MKKLLIYYICFVLLTNLYFQRPFKDSKNDYYTDVAISQNVSDCCSQTPTASCCPSNASQDILNNKDCKTGKENGCNQILDNIEYKFKFHLKPQIKFLQRDHFEIISQENYRNSKFDFIKHEPLPLKKLITKTITLADGKDGENGKYKYLGIKSEDGQIGKDALKNILGNYTGNGGKGGDGAIAFNGMHGGDGAKGGNGLFGGDGGNGGNGYGHGNGGHGGKGGIGTIRGGKGGNGGHAFFGGKGGNGGEGGEGGDGGHTFFGGIAGDGGKGGNGGNAYYAGVPGKGGFGGHNGKLILFPKFDS